MSWTFNSGTGFNGAVQQILKYDDGRILCCGRFSTYNGITVPYGIARINPDGNLDLSFSGATTGITGSDKIAFTIAINPSDEKIYLGGVFFSFDGYTRRNIVRLNTDGSVDTGFDAGSSTNLGGYVYAIVINPSDEKIYVGGRFEKQTGTNPITITNRSIFRLNTDGSVDTGFNTGYAKLTWNGSEWIETNYGAFDLVPDGGRYIAWILLDEDENLYLIGRFNKYSGITANGSNDVGRCIIKLTPTGSIDTSFHCGWGYDYDTFSGQDVGKIKYYNNGDLLVHVQNCNTYSGISINNAIRITTGGTFVQNYVTAGDPNNGIGIDDDGNIWFSGWGGGSIEILENLNLVVRIYV